MFLAALFAPSPASCQFATLPQVAIYFGVPITCSRASSGIRSKRKRSQHQIPIILSTPVIANGTPTWRVLEKSYNSAQGFPGSHKIPFSCSSARGETPFRSSILVEDQEQRKTSKLFLLGSDPLHLEQYDEEMSRGFVVLLCSYLVVQND